MEKDNPIGIPLLNWHNMFICKLSDYEYYLPVAKVVNKTGEEFRGDDFLIAPDDVWQKIEEQLQDEYKERADTPGTIENGLRKSFIEWYKKHGTQ